MPLDSPLLGIRGWVLDTPRYGQLRSWSDGAVIVDGRHILDVGDFSTLSKTPRQRPVRWIAYPRAAVLPGLIDLQSHLPQYPAVARGQRELLPWLREHIFPLEKRFTGPGGRREAGAFFPEPARHGTTTAVIYSAIYEDSCEA